MERIEGRLLLGRALEPGVITVDHGSIVGIERTAGAADGPIVAPGFIDLQVNGGWGRTAEGGADAIREIATHLPTTGVTSFLPTVITATRDTYETAFAALGEVRTASGACVLGLHLEGPALSPRRPGAHRSDLMALPDVPLLIWLADQQGLRMMTLAPELPGATDLITKLWARGVVVSLGHTDASYEEMARGADFGATMATHLFNAMAPFGHRSPGATGRALVDDRLVVGLIADGIHTDRAAVDLAVRAKGVDRVALVTDMVSAAGMPDGTYRLGDRDVELRGGAVRLPDGTLAGSALTMDEAVRNVVRWTGAGVSDALRMASHVPATVLGLGDLGAIRIGYTADLVVLDEELRVLRTMVEGEWVYRAP